MKKSFPANIEKIHSALLWILSQLDSIAFSDHELYQIELASEEVLVNIISHGLRHAGEIEVEVMLYPRSVEITFSDEGPRFNPIEHEEFDPNLELNDRKIGGLGIHLIKKCMDEVKYERKDNRNELKLIKKSM